MKQYIKSEKEKEDIKKAREEGYTSKFDEGKERFDLLPVYPLWELVRVYTYGAKKYEDDNWRRGLEWGKIFAACLRHLFKWWSGKKYDNESEIHHLAHVAWCCLTLMDYERTNVGTDTRKDKNSLDWLDIDDEKILETNRTN